MAASIRLALASILLTTAVGAFAAQPAAEYRVPENPDVVRIARMIQALTDESFALDHRHMWAAFSDAELDAAGPTWAAIAAAA